MFAYLRHGVDEAHGAAAGPMAPVAHNLARASDADVRAIATYVASMAGAATARAGRAAAQQGAPEAGTPPAAQTANAIFVGACGGCHSGAPGAVAIDLAQATAINAPDPRNAIHVVLEGIAPPPGERGPLMPGFAGALTDQQIADVLNYLRSRLGSGPAWSDLATQVRAIRLGQEKS